MTRDEAKKLIMIISAAYPNFKPPDLTFTVNTWAAFLRDYDYQSVEDALQRYILTDRSGFAPSIGQVVDHMSTSEPDIGELEAWAMVARALRNSTYGAEAEFQKLPDAVQKAVGRPSNLREWAAVDKANVETVVQSNFLRGYRAVTAKKRDEAKLPERLKGIAAQTLRKLEEKNAEDVKRIEK